MRISFQIRIFNAKFVGGESLYEFEDYEEDMIDEIKGDDLYSSEVREDLLESDSISAEEQAFMEGYEVA